MTSPVATIVGTFFRALDAHPDALTGAGGPRLERIAADLLTTLALEGRAAGAEARDARAGLLHRIQERIERDLGDADLGPERVARTCFVSRRRLNQLFQEIGTTPGAWIRERRLDRCLRDLRDPLLAELPVAAIGARWGFADASHFSRCFRRRFGRPPSAVRVGVSSPAPTD